MTTATPEPIRVHELPVVTGRTETPRLLVPHTLIQTRRLLLRWWRDPLTLMQSLLFPALLLVMLQTVLGRQISAFSGASALYGSVPMVALVGVMSGSLAGAITLGRERDAGLLARFWVLPVHRASGLAARILAEGVRLLTCTVVLFAVGVVLGFRFEQGFAAAVALLGVPLLFGLAFATAVTTVAVFGARTAVVEAISLGSSMMMFFSTGFVPLAAYPGWARPIVEYQPMSHAINAMRGLSLGGPVREPLLATLAWSVGAIVVFAVPAAVGYRRASRR
ncbi:ABC transporter permease [Nocardia cyriacigeorgica]|uniref:ABC transporter permease n=1 Tax=Nocardia cyriacigeorgica TaxID=135487 RepID=UPI001893085C|nr:ABC transporter permease [Nocardia cyriacigeorgica]MBF6158653.1 ABC transporter permease [Nocardia cyriacigeorgica]MBF6197659.1 ABC transporter permease [Nocardia cyriacigeorgica]